MRAVVVREYGGPEQLVVADLPEPEIGPRDVLVEVRACGVDYLDVIIRRGQWRSRGMQLPHVPGHEVAGIVRDVGAEVTDVAVGDAVCAMQMNPCGRCRNCLAGRGHRCLTPPRDSKRSGGYAEYAALPAASVVQIPDGLSFEEACLIGCPLSVVYHGASDLARISPGDTVLVTGAGGGLGTHSIQSAKVCGGRVIAITRSPDKEQRLREIGADEVVVAPDGRFAPRVRELTGGEGASVALEVIGGEGFVEALRAMAPFGRMVLLGELGSAKVEFHLVNIVFQDLVLYGAAGTSREQVRLVAQLVRDGRMRAVVGETFPLEEAGRVHELMEQSRVFGRAVLVP